VKLTILIVSAVVLAVLILLTMIRAILGPRFTDRVIAINMINTMVVAIICILSVWQGEDYLVDVALIYALLSFLTVVVLSRLVLLLERKKERKDCHKGKKGGTELG
jgi:multicomponent Na+:H+ antiporter subunit F